MMKKFKLSLFCMFLVGIAVSCSRGRVNVLEQVLGADNLLKVRVIEASNHSTPNDTVLIWSLAHDKSSVDVVRHSRGFKIADRADFEYAVQQMNGQMPSVSILPETLYRSKVNNYDCYWVFDGGDRSVLMVFEY